MSALAKWLHGCGKRVAGSDMRESVYTEELRSAGIHVCTTGGESVRGYEAVVYTDAVPETDRQLAEAAALGITVISRGQLLYEMSRNFGNVIAVSGCHGKTTCTAMLAHIFKAAGKGFCAHIGGRDVEFSNYFRSGDEFFITEACEYKKNFLLLKPDVAVILNTRPDHMECYGGEEELKACYAGFASSADVTVKLYGENCCEGLTFGFDKNADYHARFIDCDMGNYTFTAYEGDRELGQIKLRVYGKHNVLNALAAISVARSSHISFPDIKRGLEEFRGVERRFEKLGTVGGAAWIADYAHHPDEIRESIRTAKKIAEGRVFVVFQPHTYSRTKNLMKNFIRVLSPQSHLMIYKTYAAREYFDDKGSALTLSQKVKRSRYGEEERDIADFAAGAGKGDVVLFLGAGDIYDIAKRLFKTAV